MTLDTSIELLKNIGSERAKFIKSALGIYTVEDFLHFFPIRYLDKSRVHKISEIAPGDTAEVQLKGKISEITEVNTGKASRLTAKFRDGTGTIELVWFKHTKWFLERLPQAAEVYIFGKLNEFNGRFSMPHPEIEIAEDKKFEPYLTPVYPSSEKLSKRGVNQKLFESVLKTICSSIPTLIVENIPAELMNSLKLMSRPAAYLNIHFPADTKHLEAADRRLKFEEAFYFQLSYGLKKQQHKSTSVGNPFPLVGGHFTSFYEKHIPFELTNAQKRVLKEIRTDMKKPVQMNRLLQGDVGSGKTMVALLSMLLALDNGFQSCLMAPTEILAQQHYNGISGLLAATDVKVGLLTGSTRAADRKVIHEELLSGNLPVLVGTHALLEDVVRFRKLGLAVIDEQHRFGVAQRAKLWAKNNIPPHILVMTATPIPRTLAMSFYSDLDVSVIDELPTGRKPIITAHRREKDRLSVYRFAKEQIHQGRQVYFVFPLIKESETLDYKNLMEGFEHISDFFDGYDIVILHGRMRPDEKDAAMRYFASGKAQIMVATTVIEVGVNVPNASVMVIESAEKFGLSQLHQLRGRVGRGAEQSYCILNTSDKLTKDSRIRIKTMCETNDGFKISEVDMQLRGPGNILGTQQSGTLDFRRLDLVTDGKIISAAKNIVEELLAKDPRLQLAENVLVRDFYLKQFRAANKWGKIS